ncbi:hypothetical protein OUZ56_012138 [Daphnia magna]|uniref:Uncharacterized protein n=1 Tax=Daphnia magna TaxID=35525 RepID=A0ABQ9Z2C7_9CRUS|nr:hypothetical protein OUZ56_012138 [Daphnia magna]
MSIPRTSLYRYCKKFSTIELAELDQSTYIRGYQKPRQNKEKVPTMISANNDTSEGFSTPIPESAIGSGSESHIGPGHFQLESPNLVHFCYANITHKWTRFGDSSWKLPGPMCDSDLQPKTAKNNIVSISGITEMDKVWRLKLEMTRTDVRFRYAANNGAKQYWTNIQHSNIKN